MDRSNEAWIDRSIGQVLAKKYRVDRLIGRGGMGAVFEAWQLDLGRTVAIKLLLADAVADDLARFRKEALSVAAASHVNVVQLFDCFMDHDPPFLAMELLEGASLSTRLASVGSLSVRNAVDVALQILAALEAMHRHGIVHRDLKPSNVFLTSTALGIDLVKVLDFGIAKFDIGGGKTATGILLGTPGYMAPEQLMEHATGAWTDIHAVGLILYEMLAGHRAFGRGADAPVRVLREVPPRLDRLRPEVGSDLSDVVARALAKDPRGRFADPSSMRLALQATRAESALSDASDKTQLDEPPGDRTKTQVGKTEIGKLIGPSMRWPQPAPPVRSRRALVVILAVLLGVVMLAVGLVVAGLLWGLSLNERERKQVAAISLPECPPPSTCIGRLEYLGESQGYCSPSASAHPVVTGDLVYVRVNSLPNLVRVTEVTPQGRLHGRRTLGANIEAAQSDVIGRACRAR